MLVVVTNRKFVEEARKQIPEADLAIGMLFTEKGIAVQEIRIDNYTAEVYGLVATDEGVVAGAAAKPRGVSCI